MTDFFTSRVNGYDEHMLSNVEGCREGYIKMASIIPAGTLSLLDLGCGTGLELDEIFKFFPDVTVTGIDLTPAMLDKLKEKHPDKKLNLICGDYFTVDFGKERFDCAVSFQTMHHFSHEKKRELYKKVHATLVPNGCYIECDYMLESQDEEDFLFSENARIRKEYNIPDGEFYHFDTPCTVGNQISILESAGFYEVEQVFKAGNTTILAARRHL